MGLSGCRILCDDLVSSTAEVESTEIMSQAVRTMTTDLFTRLTNDNYGKGLACALSLKGSATPTVAEMEARERRNEEQGLQVTVARGGESLSGADPGGEGPHRRFLPRLLEARLASVR